MDVGKASANNFPTPSANTGVSTLNATTGDVDKDQAMKNALNSLQAKYGEKPKEPRQVKKQLDKDDFMKIMITEMKHQDPTKPMDSDKMATQMAQITSVEQMKNVGQAVEKLAEKSNAADRLAMSTMIGKTVTVDKGRFNHLKGTVAPVSFDLPEAAQKVKLTVLDEHGEVMTTRELEPQPAGANTYNWDGTLDNTTQAKSGSYTVRIEAENAKGAKIKINPITQENIIGVSFEGGEANFLVGDIKDPQRVGFKSVIRIEADARAKNGIMNRAVDRKGDPAADASAQNPADAANDPNAAGGVANPNAQNLGAPGMNPMEAVAQNAMSNPAQQNSAQNGMPPNPALAQANQNSQTDNQPVKPEGFANGLKE